MDYGGDVVTVLTLITCLLSIPVVGGGLGAQTANALSIDHPSDIKDTSTPVANCRTINESGRYVLTQDIEQSSAGECITIVASDVVFDGRGHTIDARRIDTQTEGIAAGYTNPPIENITIKNLVVTDWTQGIGCRRVASNVTIENVTARRNGLQTGSGGYGYGSEAYGIYVGDLTTNVTISNSQAINNSVGIYIANTSNNLIRNNLVQDNQAGGIVLEGNTWHNRVVNNRIAENAVSGIEVEAKPRVESNSGNLTAIHANRLWGNERGILLEHTNATISVTNNRIMNTTYESMWVALVDGDVTIADNYIQRANGDGIVIDASTGIVVRNNTIRQAAGVGIIMKHRARGNILENNDVVGARIGLHITGNAGRAVIRGFSSTSSLKQSILLGGGGYNTLVNATVSGGHGVEVESIGNHLQNITVTNPRRYGVRLDNAPDTLIETARMHGAGAITFVVAGQPPNVTIRNLSMTSGRLTVTMSRTNAHLGPVDTIPSPPSGKYGFGIGAQIEIIGVNATVNRPPVLTLYYSSEPDLDVTLWTWTDKHAWTELEEATVHPGRGAISAPLASGLDGIVVPLASSPPPTLTVSVPATPTQPPSTPTATPIPSPNGTGTATPGFGLLVGFIALLLCAYGGAIFASCTR